MAINGTLVPVSIDYHDDRGWTDQESPYTDKVRKTWALEAGAHYQRVQVVAGVIKIFPPETQANTIEVQSVVQKDSSGAFPGVFYYKVQ